MGKNKAVTIVQPRQIETSTLKDLMAVKVPKELLNAKEDWHFFLDLKQVKALKIKALDLKTLRTNKKLRHYIYFTGKLDDLLGFGADSMEDPYWDKIADHFPLENSKQSSAISSLTLLEDPTFSTKNLIYCWPDANLWYQFRADTPLSPTYYIYYIGGVTNERYDLDKAEEILKKNKFVSHIQRIEIPYYNQSEGYNKAVEFHVRLPQEDHDKIVKYYRDEKKEEFWSCRVRECLSASHSIEPFNILGLKDALKST